MINYNHWLERGAWTIHEACCLLLGVVYEERLFRRDDNGIFRYERIPRIKNTKELIWSDIKSKRLKSDAGVSDFKPETVIKWALSKHTLADDIPKQLKDWYESQKQQAEPLKTKPSSDDLHPRERNTLLKIIAVMAKDGYNNDLSAPYGELSKIISEQAQLLGYSITAETVGDKLKSAKQFLDSN